MNEKCKCKELLNRLETLTTNKQAQHHENFMSLLTTMNDWNEGKCKEMLEIAIDCNKNIEEIRNQNNISYRKIYKHLPDAYIGDNTLQHHSIQTEDHMPLSCFPSDNTDIYCRACFLFRIISFFIFGIFEMPMNRMSTSCQFDKSHSINIWGHTFS